MIIEVQYDGSEPHCRLTEYFGDQFSFVDFNHADEFSQIYAMDAFKKIIDNWDDGKNSNT